MCKSPLQYLLLEVANGVLVSVREEIQNVVFDVILLQVVHQVGTVALTLKRPEKRQYLQNQILKKRCVSFFSKDQESNQHLIKPVQV